GVGPFDEVDVVENRRDRAGDVAETVGVDSAGTVRQVDDHAHHLAAAGCGHGNVLEQQPGVVDDRADGATQAVGEVGGTGAAHGCVTPSRWSGADSTDPGGGFAHVVRPCRVPGVAGSSSMSADTQRHPDRHRSRRALLGIATTVLALSGCGLRLDTPPPQAPMPDEAESLRQDAAAATARLLGTTERTDGAGPASEVLTRITRDAEAQLAALGGVWQAWPDGAPEGVTPPEPAA